MQYKSKIKKKYLLFLQLISYFATRSYCVILSELNNEKKLISHLVDNYQVKYGRPVNNMTEKVTVYFECQLLQIIDLVSSFFIF